MLVFKYKIALMLYASGLIIWVLLSYLVGKFSVGKTIGFWGGFLISLIISLLIGFIVALISLHR